MKDFKVKFYFERGTVEETTRLPLSNIDEAMSHFLNTPWQAFHNNEHGEGTVVNMNNVLFFEIKEV